MAKTNDIISALFEQSKKDTSSTDDSKGSRDIIGSDAAKFSEEKVKPTLTSQEKARTTNISTIMAETFLKIQKAQEPDKKESTIVGESTAKAQEAKAVGEKKMAKSSSLWKLALLAAAAAAFKFGEWVSETFGEIGEFFTKALIKGKSWFKGLKSIFKNLKIFDKIKDWFKSLKLVSKITGWFKDLKIVKGLKGIFKGGGFLSKMLKGVMAKVGGKLLKTLKFIPVLGSIVSFGFAYTRFKEGDYIAAIFELISGIANLIPGAGWIVSAIIDGGLLLYDLWNSEKEQQKKDPKGETGFLHSVRDKFMSVIKGKARYLPLIGGFVHMGESYEAFKNGEWKKGFISLGKGLLGFIGGQGLVDGAMWLVSFISTPNETETSVKDGDVGFIGKMRDSFMALITSKARYLPLIGGIMHMTDAYNSFTAGNWKEGFKSLGKGILGHIGGQGLVDGAMWLVSLLDSDTSAPDLSFEVPSFDFITELWSDISDIVGSASDAVAGWVKAKWEGLKDSVSDVMSSLPVVGDLIKSKSKPRTPENKAVEAKLQKEILVDNAEIQSIAKSTDAIVQIKDQVKQSNDILRDIRSLSQQTVKALLLGLDNDELNRSKSNRVSQPTINVSSSNGGNSGNITSVSNGRSDYSNSPYSINVPSV